MKKFAVLAVLGVVGAVAAKLAGPAVSRAVLRSSLEMTKSAIRKMEDEVNEMMNAGREVPPGTLDVLEAFYNDAAILQSMLGTSDAPVQAGEPEADAIDVEHEPVLV